MNFSKKTYYLIAGGTGGHISPAIAIAEKLLNLGERVCLVVTHRDMRFSFLQDLDSRIAVKVYPASKLPKIGFAFIAQAIRFMRDFLGCQSLLKNWILQEPAAAFVGFGGFVSAPALWFARRNGIELLLCEQNSYLGLVNRLFFKSTKRLYAAFPIINRRLKARYSQYYRDDAQILSENFAGKIIVCGNPIRQQALSQPFSSLAVLMRYKKDLIIKHSLISDNSQIEYDWDESILQFPTILVSGGSQGAAFLNEWALRFTGLNEEVTLILLTGTAGNKQPQVFQNLLTKLSIAQKRRVIMLPFQSNMGSIYQLADLAVARSGGSLYELASWAIPMVLVPYPYAADNHQYYNAQFFAQQFGCPIVLQQQGQQVLSETVYALIDKPEQRMQIKEKLLKKRYDNAADFIAKELCRFT